MTFYLVQQTRNVTYLFPIVCLHKQDSLQDPKKNCKKNAAFDTRLRHSGNLSQAPNYVNQDLHKVLQREKTDTANHNILPLMPTLQPSTITLNVHNGHLCRFIFSWFACRSCNVSMSQVAKIQLLSPKFSIEFTNGYGSILGNQ